MRFRPITEAQALAIRQILVDECGYKVGDHDSFVFDINTARLHPYVPPVGEYRFCGSLGFGGKFRNNGNNENVPYVDCYPEDVNDVRRAAIANANRRIALLFRDTP